MLLIFVATERWSSTNEFTTYLSNAATMTSLLLGVVAIFYSFISNDGMSRSLGGISTVTNDVREARADIKTFVDQTKESARIAEVNNEMVRNASSELSDTMQSLSGTLEALSKQNENLQNLMSSIPTKFDQWEVRFGNVAKAVGEKPQVGTGTFQNTALTDNAVDSFLKRATLSQNLLCIACVCAYEKKIDLDMKAFVTAIEWNGPIQLAGFLACMHAIQLCSRNVVEGPHSIFAITAIHPRLKERAKPYLVEYLEKTYKDAQEDREKWLAKVSAVEALFAAPRTKS